MFINIFIIILLLKIWIDRHSILLSYPKKTKKKYPKTSLLYYYYFNTLFFRLE